MAPISDEVLRWIIGDDGVIRGPAGNGRLAPVARDDLAEVAAAVLTADGAHDGQPYAVKGPASLSLHQVAEELAELVIQAEGGLVAQLLRQLVHGDFWDNNVLFRGGRAGAGGRLRLHGRAGPHRRPSADAVVRRLRPRRHGGPAQERAQLGRLVASYDAGLEVPLSAAERAALAVAMARQPLSSFGGWVARRDAFA